MPSPPPPNAVRSLRSEGKRILDSVIVHQDRIALLDFPHHPNVGDSAIWLGELDYLKSRGMTPSYVASLNTIDWNALDINSAGTIILHGGGNFGDLWVDFHNFRLAILRRYPHRPIIQLPQTLHFCDKRGLQLTARTIAEHGNFTLLVRDHISYDIARKHFDCHTLLCPDMAFQIDTLGGIKEAHHSLLLHLRHDKESALTCDIRNHFEGDVLVSDWPSDPSNIERRVMPRTLFKLAISGRATPPHGPTAREELYRQLATYRLARGINLLSSARRIVTDRLHGHILSLMIGKPHMVIDNSYGKISSFMTAWNTGGTENNVVSRNAESFSSGASKSRP